MCGKENTYFDLFDPDTFRCRIFGSESCLILESLRSRIYPRHSCRRKSFGARFETCLPDNFCIVSDPQTLGTRQQDMLRTRFRLHSGTVRVSTPYRNPHWRPHTLSERQSSNCHTQCTKSAVTHSEICQWDTANTYHHRARCGTARPRSRCKYRCCARSDTHCAVTQVRS